MLSSPVYLQGVTLYLLAEKALFWPEQSCLLIADLHLGKGAHFRKHGIAIPEQALYHDLQRLENMLNHTGARRIIALGDLMHSNHNRECDIFGEWLEGHPSLRFTLVKGNHDILPISFYRDYPMEIVDEQMLLGPFELAHMPVAEPASHYRLCGHIHPGYRVSGRGRQSVMLPCLYAGAYQAILPAFGGLTGLAEIRKQEEEDKIWIIAGNEVLALD